VVALFSSVQTVKGEMGSSTDLARRNVAITEERIERFLAFPEEGLSSPVSDQLLQRAEFSWVEVLESRVRMFVFAS
jgi:hypothetical protein